MRRSAAPSAQKKQFPASQKPCNFSPACNFPSIQNTQPFTQAKRSTADVLNLLNSGATEDFNIEEPVESTQPDLLESQKPIVVAKSSTDSSGKLVYSVCYGKKTTKKNKTYSDDGFLELSHDHTTIVLKDSNGKFVSRSTKQNGMKFDFGESDTVSVGGNEVQIVEICENSKFATNEAPVKVMPIKRKSDVEIGRNPKRKPYGMPLDKKNKENDLDTGMSCSQLSKRSTESILNLLNGNGSSNYEPEEVSEPIAPEPMQQLLEAEPQNEKLTYNVCYGKKTTKKNKTFQDDGILELSADRTTVVLKDTNGKYVSKSTKQNGMIFDFNESDIIGVGGNEVQIVDLCGNTPHQDIPPPMPKKKFEPMRRPLGHTSLRNKVGLAKKQAVVKTTDDNNEDQMITNSQLPKRSTASILNLLNGGNDDSTNQFEETTANPISIDSVDLNPFSQSSQSQMENLQVKIIYNVCYGKKTSKKNKTFQNDGTLELSADRTTVVLKDKNGKFVSRSTKQNGTTFDICESSIIGVGNSEVQIVEICNTTSQKCETPLTKKKSKAGSSQKISYNLKVGLSKKSNPTLKENLEQFVMPSPPPEHQWLFNKSKKPLQDVIVDSILAQVLRPHQKQGIIFLYKNILGFYNKQLDDDDIEATNYMGAILADEMGLGKTLQCITLIWTLLKQGPYGGTPVITKVLIVAPSSLLKNWQNEFQKWLVQKHRFINTLVIDSKDKIQEYIRCQNSTPVVIISYEMLVRHFADIEKATNFDLMVCDEGHRLKNDSNKVTMMLASLTGCTRRILLTGTPIQNDLQEYYALMNFVNPGCLGSYSDYKGYFEQPIIDSQQVDAKDDVKELGEQRANELNSKTQNFMLRRTQEINQQYLPVKHEVVVFCHMTDLQKRLYEATTSHWFSREIINEIAITSNEINHLSIIVALKKLCNHPLLVHSNKNNTENATSTLYEKLTPLISPNLTFDVNESAKLQVLDKILTSLAEIQVNPRPTKDIERVVVVSYFTQTLDMLAAYCEQHNFKYCRLDGSTQTSQRNSIVQRFNQPRSDIFVFLLSARAGGVGLNLIGASRLVLYDTDWNPATDLQAMARIWRDGQQHRNVYIYRLITRGTVEEKIFQRQLFKTGLSGAVIDPTNGTHNIKLSNEDLKDLFTLSFPRNGILTGCSTHDLLNCECLCDGTAPTIIEEKPESDIVEEKRNCQLGNAIEDDKNEIQALRMNELKLWEHHAPPFNNDFLNELALNNTGNIVTFIFRNKTTSMKV